MVDKNKAIENLNRNIEFIKERKGLHTDAELCREAGIAKGTLSSVRGGEKIPMIYPFFERLCAYSGCSIDVLIGSDLAEESESTARAVDESMELELKKYAGVYTAYYFGTSNLKGRERMDDREALCYAVVLIYRENTGVYRCIADFGLTREQQEERYNACFCRNENGKMIRLRNYGSEFINRYIGDGLYDGTFTITDGTIVMALESTQDCITMMMNKIRNNAGRFNGGLSAAISVCKGVRPVPVMQIVGLARGIVSDSPEMIANKLYLSYPSIKCQEEDETEIFQMIRFISDEHRESAAERLLPVALTPDQERTLLHDAMSRAINRTVKRNLARTIRVTEVDDDDWNQMIRRYEEV